MWKKIFILISCLLFVMLCWHRHGLAAETRNIVMNEIAWMGNDNSSADEWIELYNNTDAEIDLTGWKIISRDGSPEILLEGKILSRSFFLIERTDDNSAPDVSADFITSFDTGLGNTGEVLELQDSSGYLIDSTPLITEEKWAAGNNDNKFTMERIRVLDSGEIAANWQNSVVAGGTARAENFQEVADEGEEKESEEDKGEIKNSKLEIGEEEKDEGELEIKNSKLEIGEEEKDGGELKIKNSKLEIGEDVEKSIKTFPAPFVRRGSVMEGKIIINEIFPNPKGVDIKDEFIELKNIGGQEINIEGWVIKNKEHQYKIVKKDFPIAIIPIGAFFLLKRSITNLALNNSGDKIEIFSVDGVKKDYVSYSEYSRENESYIKINDKWQWSSAITPIAENFFIAPNRAPQAIIDSKGIKEILVGEEIIFDGSDSFDPDGDKLSFFWKTSDGAEIKDIVFKKSFSLSGEYKINLKAVDKFANESSAEFKIKVLDDWKKDGNVSGFEDGAESIIYQENFEDIEIAEIMPNPEGNDNGEWIKLYNNEDYAVNLGGWVLDDEEGGSDSYYIPSDVVIGARSFFALEKDKTGIALNNDSDEARLFDPNGELKSKIEYDKAAEGEIARNEKISLKSKVESSKLKGDSMVEANGVEWNELKSYEGEEIKIQGYVSAKPGVLGKQVFYLTDGAKGIEVYSWAKNFPELEIGDCISVFGKLENKDGWKLSIEGKDSISVLSYEHPPLAIEKFVGDIKEEDIYSLISIKGQIVEKKSPNLYLDDGKDEIKVYIMDSAGIEIKELKVGDNIFAIGILDYLNGAYRLLPRGSEDLKFQEGRILGAQSEVNATESEFASENEFENEFSASKNSSDNAPDHDRKKMIIILSSTFAALAVIGGIAWKRSARGSGHCN
ncbi:MAG: lamin tail domain-containing protein [bacterium]